MKTITLLILSLSTLFFGGCETKQLSIDQDGPSLAPVLGVDETDIKFLSYCEFGRVWNIKPSRAGIAAQPDTAYTDYGIVAVSDSKVYFLNDEKELLRSFPFGQFRGVANTPSQIQLKHNNQVMVLELNGSSDKELTQQKYQTMILLLIEGGVPKYEAPKTYSMKLNARSKWTEGGPTMRAFPSAYPRNQTKRAQANESQGN